MTRAAVLEGQGPRRLVLADYPTSEPRRDEARVRVFAEHVVLGEGYLHPFPDSLSPVTATLIETLATVRHAQELFPLSFKELTVYGSRALTPVDFEPAIPWWPRARSTWRASSPRSTRSWARPRPSRATSASRSRS